MYGISNGTLEVDQAANVPALGRNQSCVCHVCVMSAQEHYDPTILASAFPEANAYNMCVFNVWLSH